MYPAVSHEYFVPNLFGSLHRNHFGLPTSFPVSFTPLERARQCYFSRQFSKASSDTDTTVDWRISSSNKLIQTRTKLENAKHKLEDAKQNFIEDIQDTKARMRVKMDEIIERENIFTIPNFLCISRIVAAPFLCHLVLTGSYDMALGLFMLAGATDLADGWIARVFPSQASKLGSFLDPLADKVLVAVLFLALTCNGLIPIPLTGLIIYRDVVIIAAASYVRYRSLPAPRTLMRYFDATHATVQLSPTLISKVNTAVQLSLITATLAQPVINFPSPAAMTALWYVLTLSSE
ncbi:hypothetical protein HAZT_HAZT011523 [Hyalella azteca]|uniref:cardiolipin synthase (CMP-forming) n=1 Tax=Hyalella azteca TaxID=294128 RepID=A0A6A0GX45_HYAAZ|nr:hypothetical protein HAZT_HAZT011523 [Hyalella azteca]